MNELQIKTNNFTPAKVDFNYKEVENFLNEVLKKYNSLVFTEETVQDCNKTIAELRKGKKSLDDFRKKTKKELTKSVTEFENQCKELNKKFDEVIDPLVEQSDFFEEERKNEKKQKVQRIIDELIKGQGLNEKYASQLIIKDEYLNKTKTLKSIREELTVTAESLGVMQDKEEADKEIIKSKVELVNAKYNINLTTPPYVSMLDYTDVQTILNQIEKDSESLKNKIADIPVTTVVAAPFKDEEIFVDTYEIEGTEKQLDALEEFLNKNGYKWSIKD